MRRLLIASWAMLAGCASTAEMANAAPARIYHSTKARDAVAECLLNRVSSDEMLPEKRTDGGVTTVAFAGRGLAMRPGIYRFAIRDEGSGSVIEAWRLAHASLANAETCF